MFIGELQEGDDTFTKTDGRGIFTVDIQRLGLPGQLEDKSIEGSSHVWRGDNDAFSKR